MKMTRSDMNGKPSRINSMQRHRPPKALRETPPAAVPKHRKRSAEHTLLSQIAYMETLPEKERGTLIINKWPFDTPMPDFVRLRANMKPKTTRTKLKEKTMNAIMTRVWAFVRDVILQWAFPFPIFKKAADGVTPLVDENGKKVVDWVATVSARALSLAVVLWGTVEVLGLSVAEWAQRIAGALGLPLG